MSDSLEERHSAGTVMLVRPAAFGFNAEAARTNVFSHASKDPEFASTALREFEGVARRLSDAGVEVLVLDDSAAPPKPDALFPNNWFSTHWDGTLVLYPMATPPRRLERRLDAVTALLDSKSFVVRRVVDLTGHEAEGRFLEGTGSLVLDRPRRQAYANRSSRTDPAVVDDFGEALGYSTLMFDAFDPGGRPIYHSNVLLSLGTRFAVLCIEAVAEQDRKALIEAIEAGGRAIVELSFAQLRHFGCNLLELRGRDGDPVIALSSAALAKLLPAQLRALEGYSALVDCPIPTIEAVGGGSVRCMVAEVHLPRR